MRPTEAIKILKMECWPASECFLGHSPAGDSNSAGRSLVEQRGQAIQFLKPSQKASGPGATRGRRRAGRSLGVFSGLGTPPERRGGQLVSWESEGGDCEEGRGRAGRWWGMSRRRWVRVEEKRRGKEEGQGKSGAWLRGKKSDGADVGRGGVK